ncbi:hypothetical protein GQR58_024355 [Nymphon striatum]|nr:hypothetical protein GQR58_024355 [Nymphon striatum]
MANLDKFRRVLVTGATGFLGGHLVRRLLDADVDVLAVGRNRAQLSKLPCKTLHHDIAHPFPMRDVGVIDAIVHCAALSAPFGKHRDFMSANVDGTQNVLDLARDQGIGRLVHISTPSIYFSYCDQLDVSEDHPLPTPVNHYAATKAMAENLVRDQMAETSVILRPRGIYGPGDVSLLPRVLRAAKSRPLPRLRGGVAAIDLTYVDDVVEAIIAALSAGDGVCGEAYNISGGEVLTVNKIVEDACRMAGISPRWRPVPLGLAMTAAGALEGVAALRPNRPEPMITRYGLGLFAYRQSLNLSKAQRHLGWGPRVPFQDGLARTFEARAYEGCLSQ